MFWIKGIRKLIISRCYDTYGFSNLDTGFHSLKNIKKKWMGDKYLWNIREWGFNSSHWRRTMDWTNVHLQTIRSILSLPKAGRCSSQPWDSGYFRRFCYFIPHCVLFSKFIFPCQKLLSPFLLGNDFII